MRKHKKINILIPQLLEQSKKYSKVFKDKNKINNIFTEFEIKSSHHFNFFVKESLKRYKNMRLGNDLDKLMLNSEKRRTAEAQRVLTDNFFSKQIIKQEKKNTKYYTSDKIYKNLKKTIKLLKDTEADTSKISNKEKSYNKKMEKTKSSYNEKEIIPNVRRINELLNKGKEDINSIFKNEECKILKMFDKYREDVNILQQIGEQSPEKYASIHKKLDISLPKLEMINYTHYEPPKLVEKDVEILQKKTLDKIMPFTKYNIKNNNRNKSCNNTKELNFKKIFQKLLLNKKVLFNPKMTILNSRKFGKIDMNDTNNVVFNTAYKELRVKNIFNEKRTKLTEILGYDAPKINDYKNIIKNQFKEIKYKRNKNNKEKIKEQKFASMTYNDKINLDIDNEIYLLTKVEKDLFKKPHNSNKISEN